MFTNPLLHFIAVVYEKIVGIGSNLQSLFLLWVRLTWGHQFYLTGMGKFHNIEQTAQYFASLGIAHPELQAHVVGTLEAAGGALLVVGLASRFISIPLLITLLVALGTAHIQIFSGLHFLTDPAELAASAPFPFLMMTLLMICYGPGRISLDGWLKRWAEGQPKY